MAQATVESTVPDLREESEVVAAMETDGLLLVDFFAAWCTPCRAMEPVLEAVAAEQVGKVRIVRIDVDRHPAVVGRHDVLALPTLVFFRGRREVGRLVGGRTKRELNAAVRELC